MPAATTRVLASFNAATGKVASVMPYAANRSASDAGAAPKAVREGGRWSYAAGSCRRSMR